MRLALALLVVPALAHAEPRIEVLDRGEFVEIIGHDIKSTRTNLSVARQRIEIPLQAFVAVKRAQPTDATVMLAEVDPDARAFSVKLNLDHNTVTALAKVSQAMQIGDDLHLIIPRKVPADGATVTLPEPTLPVIAKAPEPEKQDKPVVVEPPPPPKPLETKPAAAVTVPAETKPPAPPIKLGQTDEGSSTTSMLGGGALLAAAAGLYMFNKRRKAKSGAPVQGIDVIAQRSLGGRARVVWLAAGSRELMVAVTPQQVRLLGEWPRGEAQPQEMPSLPRARTENGLSPRTTTRNLAAAAAKALADTEAEPKPTVSPAINGILRLRNQRLGTLSDDVATGNADEDATWARELLAATSARR